jgi:K+/H+ antiporter YhaU regulatory subunit KhtT
MRTRVEETKDRVNGDLELADAYDAKAQDVLTKLAAVKKVNESLGLLNKARNLPSCNGVKPNQPPVAEIVATAETALEKTVEDTCQRLSKLASITDFGRQDDDLKSCHSDLDGKTHLQHKVTDALAALLRAKGELEARQSEDATLATIEALSSQVPMPALEKNLETLDAITGGSEKVAARLAAKRKEIADQITALTTFAEGLVSRIESVKDANELRAVEREIDGKAASFAGHEANEAKLNAATTRCSRLAEFFSTITPLSQRGLNNPQDLVTVLDDCAAVRQQFSSGLSQVQSELIDQIEASKRNDAEAKGRAAKEWLQGMEKAWGEDGSDPAAFLPKLGGSPAFLPDDAKVALLALRATVREKLEANDEEWIVSRFQGISDKNRRQNLVERLQGLLSVD